MQPTYTPDTDIYEPYSDGSGRKLVASAGVPIAWATARELGLVIGEPPAEKRGKVKTSAGSPASQE